MDEFLNSFQKIEFDKVRKYIRRYVLSSLGGEHVDQLVPMTDTAAIRESVIAVSEMKRLLETDDQLPFQNIFDIRTGLHRAGIENYVLPSDELHRIEEVLITSRMVHTFFTRRVGLYPAVGTLAQTITPQKVVEYNIHSAIDEEGNVRDAASRELVSIRKEMNEKNSSLKKSLGSMLRAIAGKEWAQEDIITTRDGRMVIPVKVEHKNKVPGFIHSASASGATVFIEPTETLELNNDIRTLQFRERREIERILRDLTMQVSEVREDILRNVQILGLIDFIHAKAKYSIEIIGSEPQISDSGRINLLNAYHPILLHRHGRKDVVPLTIEIPEGKNTLVITGPNVGGKSVLMKTVGLLSMMLQAGCHIPASSESEMRVFSDLFVDMGDEQSIENDLSSFSSHLANLRVILENARETSLVLIDEIGSGTDPSEGSSIAAAVLEELTNIGSTNIVTTHHGMLKTFAFEHPRIENGAMEFDQETLKPTFRYRSGVPGSSYAIEMAERMQMPESIILRARELQGSSANKLENLIIDLERQSQELQENLLSVSQEKNRLDSLNIVYQTRVTSLEKELKDIRLRALEEANRIVEKANSVIENSVREIKETSAEKETVKRLRDNVAELRKEFTTMKGEIQKDVPAATLNVGDSVRIKGGTSDGEIASQLDEQHYLVLIGDLKVKVHRDELEFKAQKSKSGRRSVHAAHPEHQDVRREIDLRGMYGEEAVDAVDKFLDDAILAGLHRVDIIHGKGTGALRKKITDYLKSHKSIKSFRLGEWNEGGSGVTVVELN
jgi:DNA mismatch repair protein MutS2